MRMVRFNEPWYRPRRGRRAVWWGVVIVVLVFVLGIAGYGAAVLGALATAVASAAASEVVKASLRSRPRSA
jgi:L-alanine-DL-glutamate epimerase-like enolase superfamily enzyme